jgi:cation diffusion facilitator family transporter
MKNEKNRVAFMSILAAVFLTGFKLIVGVFTGSLGILSEALHSALDMVAAAITYFSVRISDKPADSDHQFGHGKVENLSAFIETILLLVTCIWIIYEAISRLISGDFHIEVSIWSYVVVVSSMIIDITRSRILKRTALKYKSQALEADALHFSTDIWSSAVVLVGLIFANFGIFYADSIAALAVAVIIITVSYRLGKKSVDVLLDRVPENTFQQIENAVKNIKEITHYHNIKVRSSGADTFVEINIHVAPNLNIREAHEISNRVEIEILKVIERGDIHVHIEPEE